MNPQAALEERAVVTRRMLDRMRRLVKSWQEKCEYERLRYNVLLRQKKQRDREADRTLKLFARAIVAMDRRYCGHRISKYDRDVISAAITLAYPQKG